MKKLNCLLTACTILVPLLCALSITSCSGGSDAGEETWQYIPFKDKDNEKWGMISPDGKILFDGEFKHEPTIAMCGCFFVKNDNGYYEHYTAEKNPKRINDTEYRFVSAFYDGKAMVAERDCPITIINAKGEKLLTIESVGDYPVDEFSNIAEGTAVFRADTLYGVANYEGNVIVEPQYKYIGPMSFGKIVATENWIFISEYDSFEPEEESDIEVPKDFDKAHIFNKKGEEILTITPEKYIRIKDRFYGDYLGVAKKDLEGYYWGFINVKGEEVMEPKSKVRSIIDMRGDNFIFTNDAGKYGVMNIKGETLVRPEYEFVTFCTDDLVSVSSNTSKDEYEYNLVCQLKSLSGKDVQTKKYKSISAFFPTECKYGAASIDYDNITLINEKGERLQDLPDIIQMPTSNNYCAVVASDYIDINAFIDKLKFDQNSLDGVTFDASPREALVQQAKHFSFTNQPKATDYTWTKEVNMYPYINGETVNETIHFPSTLSKQTYSQKKVVDYVGYYYTYYHTVNIPTGVVFQSITPDFMEMSFYNYGKLRGKLREFYNALAKRFKAMGTVDEENKGAVVVSLPNGKKAVVYMEDTKVVARWGQLKADDLNIFSYQYNKEDLKFDDEEEEFCD